MVPHTICLTKKIEFVLPEFLINHSGVGLQSTPNPIILWSTMESSSNNRQFLTSPLVRVFRRPMSSRSYFELVTNVRLFHFTIYIYFFGSSSNRIMRANLFINYGGIRCNNSHTFFSWLPRWFDRHIVLFGKLGVRPRYTEGFWVRTIPMSCLEIALTTLTPLLGDPSWDLRIVSSLSFFRNLLFRFLFAHVRWDATESVFGDAVIF